MSWCCCGAPIEGPGTAGDRAVESGLDEDVFEDGDDRIEVGVGEAVFEDGDDSQMGEPMVWTGSAGGSVHDTGREAAVNAGGESGAVAV